MITFAEMPNLDLEDIMKYPDDICVKYNSYLVALPTAILHCPDPETEDEPIVSTYPVYISEVTITKNLLQQVVDYILDFSILKILFQYKGLVIIIDTFAFIGLFLVHFIGWFISVFGYTVLAWLALIVMYGFTGKWFSFNTVLQVSFHTITVSVLASLVWEQLSIYVYFGWTFVVCFKFVAPLNLREHAD